MGQELQPYDHSLDMLESSEQHPENQMEGMPDDSSSDNV
jgi:hypothetical protein